MSGYFFGGKRRGTGLRLNNQITVLLCIVILSCFLKHAYIIPLNTVVVSSWARIVDGRGVLEDC
jgi:hypothetical protein